MPKQENESDTVMAKKQKRVPSFKKGAQREAIILEEDARKLQE
jgi:hypothetical protein